MSIQVAEQNGGLWYAKGLFSLVGVIIRNVVMRSSDDVVGSRAPIQLMTPSLTI